MQGSWWSDPTAKHAYWLSWFSVVVTLICTFAGIVLYAITGSSLCLVFGVENSVDFASSVIVLWRFFVPHDLTDALEKELQHRETRASIAISIIMGLLGIGILMAAIDDFMTGPSDQLYRQLVLGLSFISIIISGGMAVIKFNYSVHLGSESLYKDGICSTIGAVMGAALFFNTLIQNAAPEMWWIDPLISLLCGFFALFLAGQALYLAAKHGHYFYRWSWWMYDDGIEETGDLTLETSKTKESEIV